MTQFISHSRKSDGSLSIGLVNEIVELDKNNGNDDVHGEESNGYATKADFMIVAVHDGRVRGKVEFSLFPLERLCYIDWVAAPGFGDVVLKQLEKFLKEHSIDKIDLKISIDSSEKQETVVRRVNFYFRHGYIVVKITHHSNALPEVEFYMTKNLDTTKIKDKQN
jgi:hypothetical protein